MTGIGDSVFLIEGGTPDVANISGNTAASFFGVTGYALNGIDSLVLTTDPYEGTVVMNPETIMIEVQAQGDWSIEIQTR
jgi:hypothetical protein